jgi:hypothetical protein
MWYRSSTSLLRLLCGEKENVRYSANRAALAVRKKLRVHFHSPTFQVSTAICTLRLDYVSPPRSLARFVSFVDLRSTRSWRIAD